MMSVPLSFSPKIPYFINEETKQNFMKETENEVLLLPPKVSPKRIHVDWTPETQMAQRRVNNHRTRVASLVQVEESKYSSPLGGFGDKQLTYA